MNRSITNIYYSPGGTTEVAGKEIASALSQEAQHVDLIRNRGYSSVFGPDDLVVLSLPVFGGRIPLGCLEQLEKVTAENTPAIVAAVYGNRHYDDALLEMVDLLEGRGFHVIAAGAFLARHSIFPKVAQGRPDQKDKDLLKQFARTAVQQLENGIALGKLEVPGNSPYRGRVSLPIYPTGSARCNGCGNCVKICPLDAIPASAPRKTDKAKCIRCTACIYHCPQKARAFQKPLHWLAGKAFAKQCSARREPEVFYINSEQSGS